MIRRKRKPRPTPIPTIVPCCSEIGRFRVVNPDGTASEPMTLAEAREIVRMVEMMAKRR